jgi:acetyl-CoA carboxylase biotin carboxyl carrier protein
MDIRKVQKLIEMLEKSGISEIEIKEGEESVRISRYSSAAGPMVQMMQPNTMAMQPAQSVAPSAQATSAETSAPKADALSSKDHPITSPMVGTFYSAPTPNDKPFVEIGQHIKAGDVLCIVEAMKMLNQIESERSGIIKRIMVENGQPIEFGQTLFIISDES